MRTTNLVITLSLSFLATTFGIFLLIADHEDFSRSAASTVGFSSIALISLAYASLSFKSTKAKTQIIILLCYIIGLISGSLAGGNIGLIPYIMESRQLDLIGALNYIWPMLLTVSLISLCSYIVAYRYTYYSNAASIEKT